MLVLDLKWVENPRGYSTGELLKLRGFTVASYYWHDQKDWVGHSSLPFIKEEVKRKWQSDSVEEIKALMEEHVNAWFQFFTYNGKDKEVKVD